MPEPDFQLSFFYGAIARREYNDGEIRHEIIHSTATFREEDKKHYVMFKDNFYAQITPVFAVTHRNDRYNLCYCQRYEPTQVDHTSGLEAVYTTENYDYQGRFVANISGIVRSVHLVPDFSCPTYTAISRNKGILIRLADERLIEWSEVTGDPVIALTEEEGATEMILQGPQDTLNDAEAPWYLE
ncbi:hypothetical protein BJV82DRAFT_663893 [Fennellomyces sp. T-0311]|nr:hypothetical protein BJV82DRAFT_663893 [Fennellomyces sp. T-0311]